MSRVAMVISGVWYSNSLRFGWGLLALGLLFNPKGTGLGVFAILISSYLSKAFNHSSQLRGSTVVEVNAFFWGLFFNAFWSGLPVPPYFGFFLFGLFFTVFFTGFMHRLLKPWGLPVSVLPYSVAGLGLWILRAKLGGGILAQGVGIHGVSENEKNIFEMALNGISAIHFVETSTEGFGLLVFLMASIFDRRVSIGMVCGALGMTLLGRVFEMPSAWMSSGLLAFPGAMLGACLGSRSVSLLGSVFALFLCFGASVWIWTQFEVWGWIGLGFPYVFSLWFYEWGEPVRGLSAFKQASLGTRSDLKIKERFII